jgi:hypothetical protein
MSNSMAAYARALSRTNKWSPQIEVN